MSTLVLETRFARGGNRDPQQADRCIKVPREDRTPLVKRQQKGWLGQLRPLSHFDDNVDEQSQVMRIEKRIGADAYTVIPKLYGWVETQYGPGLCSELIRDDDQLISLSLKQYIWEVGYTEKAEAAVTQFIRQWVDLGMPSRNLLLHNIVVQQTAGEIQRLVVIDGLGWPNALTPAAFLQRAAKRKAQRKAERLLPAIKRLLETQRTGGEWGYHGWMTEQQRQLGSNHV